MQQVSGEICRQDLSGRNKEDSRSGRQISPADPQIPVDHAKHIHQLPPVLLQGFDLHVEYRVRTDLPAGSLQEKTAELLPRVVFDLLQGRQCFRIVPVGQQVFQQQGIPLIAIPDHGGNKRGQLPVGRGQPAAEGNAVGYKAETLRIDFPELPVSVRAGRAPHPIDMTAVMDLQPVDMDASFRINDPQIRILKAVPDPAVQLADDRHEGGYDLLHIRGRPGHGRPGAGMAGVGAGVRNSPDGSFIFHGLLCDQDPDQFRNDQSGIGIIDLDHGIFAQPVQVIFTVLHIPQDQLCRAAGQKILLIEAEFPACRVGIIRMQEKRRIFFEISGIKSQFPIVARSVHTGHIEQAKPVPAAHISHYFQVIKAGSHADASVVYLKRFGRKVLPAFPPGSLFSAACKCPGLPGLSRRAGMIIEADPFPVETQGRDGIHHAGSQTAGTAEPQVGFRLIFPDLTEGFAVFLQDFFHSVIDSQIHQIIDQHPADHKFRGDIVYFLFTGIAFQYPEDPLADQLHDCIKLLRTASLYGFPPALDGSRPDLILQIQHHYVELHICRSHGILLFSILFPQVLIPCGDLWDNGSSVCGLPPCPSPGNIRPL